MRTRIEIYTGFLSSGKTSLINGILKNYMKHEKNTVIIQCENGEEDIDNKYISDNIIVIKLLKGKTLDNTYMKEIIERYSPERIIIEHNGMDSIDKLLSVLEDKTMRKYSIVSRIVNVIDCSQFYMLMGIVGSSLTNQIAYSDLIVLNNTDKVSNDEIKKIKKKIRIINKSGEVINNKDPEVFMDYIKDKNINNIWQGRLGDKLSILFLIIVALYISINLLVAIDFNNFNIDFSKLYILNTIFISILMESFPFLIIGVFISSVIQIFVTRDMIVKYFPRNKVLSFLVAIIGGMFFPVCDCAIVPVVSRLVKKGVPIYATVTFMLAAPIVNPIVIASTYYAFPGQHKIVIFRVAIGIIVATVAGLLFLIFPENENIILENGELDNICNCLYCNNYREEKSIKGRITTVFKHAAEEFFDVGKFLIVGGLLTSMFQVIIPKDILGRMSGGQVGPILIMMAIAFLFPLCSSSDAFIARSFANQFSINAIMGFLVLGPMIDIKNLMMLSDSFSKRFIIKLVFIVFNITFSAICFFTILYL